MHVYEHCKKIIKIIAFIIYIYTLYSCFAKLSQNILISECDDLHESDLKKHFPDFLWLMRDFDLEMTEDDGKKMSATDYVLKQILVANYKGDQAPSSRDRAVSSVRAIFPQIECLAIPSPGSGINPNRKKPIDQDFQTSIASAKQHVLSNTPLKRGFNGSTVMNGPMLAALLDEYVQALNKPGTVPNLEVSYQRVVEITVTKTTLDLAEKYRKQMSELLNKTLPLEEGDIEALKETHFVRLEEGLNGDILKMHQYRIESVKKTDTLFAVHERVYTNILREFTIELHKLIPEAADTDELLVKDEKTRKRQSLEKLEQIIIKTDQSNVLGGYISHFTKPNTEKSEITCKEVFETTYKQQVKRGALERNKIEAKYYEQAIGPAKDQVFQEMISQIPGSPQNVTMNLEEQILSWEKPIVNADDVDCYYVECYSEGEDPTRDKVHSNHFKLKKLKPKTYYSIKVQGFNDHKNRFGEYCTVVTFQTRAGKPEKPKKAKVSPQTEETVKLTITMLSEAQQNGSPVTKIIVNRRSDKNSTWESQTFPVDSSQGEFQTLVFQVNCKKDEEVLHFQIQFENEAGVSEPSDSTEVEIADMIPGKPENIIITATKAREIQMTWDPPINNPGAVNTYQIQYWEKRVGKEGFQSKSEKIASKDERSLLLTSLSPFTGYTIQVYARNEKNKKADGYSTVDIETPADVPDKPYLPTIRVNSASKATITFYRQEPSKENGSPVTKIYIERQIKGTEQAMNWTIVKEHQLMDSSESNVPNVDLPNLTQPSISCYRVVTVNSVGRSEPSQPVEVHPKDIIPGSPEGLEAETTESNSIKITWNEPKVNPQASKQYKIQHQKNVKGETWTSQNADTPSCTVSELRPNTEYNFIIQTLNETLESEKATLLVCTLPSVPPKPRLPKVLPIPNRKEFTLTVFLPLLEESGRKVTQLHVNYYSKSWDKLEYPIDTGDWPIDAPEKITHKQQIQVNIDTTGWIGICLSNEIGKSQESDLVGISSGDVTPGEPDELLCTPEARSVKLSWNVPKIHGNAAKYYEVLIINQECLHVQENCACKILENVTVQQKRRVDNKTVSYEATVNGLNPLTVYNFGVRAVNNTTITSCEGDIAIYETKTKKAQYPSAPSSFYVDKINNNSVKIRWKKPEDFPEEVYFYKVTLKDAKANKVIQVRRTLGHSTVFKNLISWKTYTASIDSYNDIKEKKENVTLHIDFDTKMSATSRVALQVLTLPTIAGPSILGESQKCDENISSSDDEFKADPDIYPSAPEKLEGKIIGKKTLQVTWNQPKENFEELKYFEVQVLEEGGGKKISHSINSYDGTSETFKLDGSTKQCQVTVTPFNYHGEEGRHATITTIL